MPKKCMNTCRAKVPSQSYDAQRKRIILKQLLHGSTAPVPLIGRRGASSSGAGFGSQVAAVRTSAASQPLESSREDLATPPADRRALGQAGFLCATGLAECA